MLREKLNVLRLGKFSGKSFILVICILKSCGVFYVDFPEKENQSFFNVLAKSKGSKYVINQP